MSRFNCPRCSRSLRFRMLPHVPRGAGQHGFSCVHCGAPLTYNESRLDQLLWGSVPRRLGTYVSGLVLFSAVSATLGRKFVYALLGLLCLALLLRHFLSPMPAYKLMEGDGSEPQRPI